MKLRKGEHVSVSLRKFSEQFARACQEFLKVGLQDRFPSVLKEKKTVVFTHDQVRRMASFVHREVVVSKQGSFKGLFNRFSLNASDRAGFEQFLIQRFECLSRIIGIVVVEIIDLCSHGVRQEKLVSQIKKEVAVRLSCPQKGQKKKRDKEK